MEAIRTRTCWISAADNHGKFFRRGGCTFRGCSLFDGVVV